MLSLFIPDEESMLDLGSQLAQVCEAGVHIHLQGELGAGKTTLVRGFLRGLGYQESVKSPTYTLVEPYELESMTVYHLDLYRLSDPGEMEYLGVQDMFGKNTVSLVEWPEHCSDALPQADVTIKIIYQPEGRNVYIEPGSLAGERIIVNAGKLKLKGDLL